jgi:hypothetical protein
MYIPYDTAVVKASNIGRVSSQIQFGSYNFNLVISTRNNFNFCNANFPMLQPKNANFPMPLPKNANFLLLPFILLFPFVATV